MLTIPDEGAGAADVQSVMFSTYLTSVILAGSIGKERVLSGGAVTSNSNMVPSVAKGSALSAGALIGWAAGTVTIGAADATLPRIDVIVATSGGLAVRAGTAATPPAPPTLTAGDVALAAAYVAPGDTSIGSTELQDLRMLQDWGPVCVDRKNDVITVNNDNTAQTYYTLTLPNGLFTAGRHIDICIGGDMLINSGTPTVRVFVTYGGSTLTSVVSGAFTAQANRRPWMMTMRLVAVTSSSQLFYHAMFGVPPTGNTDPTTGTGAIWANYGGAAARGTSAVNSDNADRALVVGFTMSVANAANEITRDFVSATLY